MMADRTASPNYRQGIICILCSAFSFALMGMFVHLADLHGDPLPAIQKSFFRNLIAFLIAGILFIRHGSRNALAMPRTGWPPLILRALFGTLGIFANFYALSHIPIGNAAILNKLSPFFAVLFSWFWIGEKINARQLLTVIGAFIGALFVIKPTFAIRTILPELVGFSSGLFAGAAYACVRRLGILQVDARLIILFFSGTSCLIALPFIVFGYHPMTAAQFWILIGAGAAAAGGQFGITAAYRAAPPRDIAVYDYTNILFAALLGYLVFGQKADRYSWLGFAIILAMAFCMYRPQRAVPTPSNHPQPRGA